MTEIEKIKEEIAQTIESKSAALQKQEFEYAAMLRDKEKMLANKLKELEQTNNT